MLNIFLPDRKGRGDFFKYMSEKCQGVDCAVLGKSILSSEIHSFKIGVGKRKIVSVAAHHGMEYITSSVLYSVVQKFSDNLTRHATSYGVNVAFLLQKFTFWFIPCLNPDGVDMMLRGVPDSPLKEREIKMNGGEDFSSWQANARGVDLNHNYDFRFGEYKRIEAEENILPGRTRYSGEYPESEPETRALANLLRTLSPELLISLHSQGKEVFSRPREDARTHRIAEKCAEILGYKHSVPVGLADFGGLSDYAGEILGIPSLTVEVGRGENPLPMSSLPAICEGVYKLLCLLPTYL